jgi:hypothetical protein
MMLTVPSVEEVIAAHDAATAAREAADQAWKKYRQVLRACIKEGEIEGQPGRQVEISRRTGRTREALRQDAMTDEEREALRQREALRRRRRSR